MPKRLEQRMKRGLPVKIQVDEKPIPAYQGETLAAVLINELGMGYRETKTGESRGPVCNMGVCYECTVHVNGQGNVRACMTNVEEGMEVSTRFNRLPSGKHSISSESLSATEARNQSTGLVNYYDVIIIGAGPAGMGAVAELAGQGLRTAVLDEQEQMGGQIYRQPPKEFDSQEDRSTLIEKVQNAAGVDWIHQAVVWGLFPKREDGRTPTSAEDAEYIEVGLENRPALLAKRVILATGAYDRLLAIPGWHLPGVMSAGGIQVFLKAQGVLPGDHIFLAGSHPFVFIVAQQIINNGGQVAGIAFTKTFPQINELINYGVKSIKRTKKLKELWSAFQSIKKEKVPIFYGRIPTLIKGNETNKEVALSLLTKQGEIHFQDQISVECDVLGMCFGFNASSELARQIGCQMEYNFDKGGWIATHNSLMQSSIPRVYVAGEITGIGGAELAEIEGRLAGCGLLKLLKPDTINLDERIKKLSREKQGWTTFANMLCEATSLPQSILNTVLQDQESYICKCEQVTMQDMMETLISYPNLHSLNAVKLVTRCGMGLCQGRYCENTLRAILHEKVPESIRERENFTARHPVKPVSIGRIIQNN